MLQIRLRLLQQRLPPPPIYCRRLSTSPTKLTTLASGGDPGQIPSQNQKESVPAQLPPLLRSRNPQNALSRRIGLMQSNRHPRVHLLSPRIRTTDPHKFPVLTVDCLVKAILEIATSQIKAVVAQRRKARLLPSRVVEILTTGASHHHRRQCFPRHFRKRIMQFSSTTHKTSRGRWLRIQMHAIYCNKSC